eukprot:Selendium_serpulae@DN4796_c0_g1_i1.p1
MLKLGHALSWRGRRSVCSAFSASLMSPLTPLERVVYHQPLTSFTRRNFAHQGFETAPNDGRRVGDETAAIQGQMIAQRRYLRGSIIMTVTAVGICFVYLSVQDVKSKWLQASTVAVRTVGLDPELAHTLVIQAAKLGLLPTDMDKDADVLRMTVMGLDFVNPIGLAAGFDKNGTAPLAFLKMGFGHVEVGSITPQPQEGNPKPRVFRLANDRAVINRYGFNSAGSEVAVKSLEAQVAKRHALAETAHGVIGVNLGKNKTTTDVVSDFAMGAAQLAPLADYLVVNLSSPNTPGLRALQNPRDLRQIVMGVREAAGQACEAAGRRAVPPLAVKLSPDLGEEDKTELAKVLSELRIDAMVISNTTLERPKTLKDSKVAHESGGLSGAPLKPFSLKLIKDMYRLTGGQIPIIACGGISSGADALDAIELGASLVQIYTMMIYEGPIAARKLKDELEHELFRRGYSDLASAVGAKNLVEGGKRELKNKIIKPKFGQR